MQSRNSISWCRLASSAIAIAAFAAELVACEPMDRSAVVVDCAAAESGIERDIEFGLGDKVGYFTFELQTSTSPTSSSVSDQSNSMNNGKFFCFTDEVADSYPAKGSVFPGAGCQIPHVEYFDDGNAFCEAHDNDEVTANGTTTSVEYARHRAAFAIRAGGHEFFGGEIQNWNWNANGVYPTFIPDGIGIWARSDVQSDKFVTIYLNDYQTAAPADTVPGTTYSPSLLDAKGIPAGCTPTAGSSASQTGVTVTVTSTDPNIQTSSSSLSMVASPGQCGNRWRRLLQTTENWQLYLLPFDTFYQDLQPNRAPNGIVASIDYNPNDNVGPEPAPFFTLAFGVGRGQNVSTWIDEVFFYRNKPVPAAN